MVSCFIYPASDLLNSCLLLLLDLALIPIGVSMGDVSGSLDVGGKKEYDGTRKHKLDLYRSWKVTTKATWGFVEGDDEGFENIRLDRFTRVWESRSQFSSSI